MSAKLPPAATDTFSFEQTGSIKCLLDLPDDIELWRVRFAQQLMEKCKPQMIEVRAELCAAAAPGYEFGVHVCAVLEFDPGLLMMTAALVQPIGGATHCVLV